jgi:hypothetical protein
MSSTALIWAIFWLQPCGLKWAAEGRASRTSGLQPIFVVVERDLNFKSTFGASGVSPVF